MAREQGVDCTGSHFIQLVCEVFDILFIGLFKGLLGEEAWDAIFGKDLGLLEVLELWGFSLVPIIRHRVDKAL